MINEPNLRDVLLALLADQKSQYEVVSSLMIELEALRETVRALDPTFAEILAEKRRIAAQAQAELVRAVIAGYDEKFQRVNEGHVC